MRPVFRSLIVLAAAALFATPAWAGPGGMIARAAFETPVGRVALVGLCIFFAPLIAYTLITEKLAERRALRDLAWMAERAPVFDWLSLRERAMDCFFRVHHAWSSEDVSSVAEWMEDWYWQNQQLVHLNKWRRNDLVNVCNVKEISGIRPLFFSHRNDGAEHNTSVVVMQITATMQDWLQRRDSEEIVEGSTKWKDVETLWTFRLRDGVWRVANIEQGTHALHYARLVRGLPAIEQTMLGMGA